MRWIHARASIPDRTRCAAADAPRARPPGPRLTEAGRTFLPHAEALLASMRDGVAAVQALNRADRGTVTLALVGTLASTTLTARLQRFRRAHPHVRLALRTALSREVTALVRRGGAAPRLRYFFHAHSHGRCLP